MYRINIFICKGDIPFPQHHENIIENSKKGHYFMNLSERLEYDLFEYDITDVIQSIPESEFKDLLKAAIEQSFKIANKLSKNESMDQSLEAKDKVFGTIYQIFNKMILKNSSKKSIFDYLAEMLFKIIKSHHLKNGNKRIAFTCLMTFMQMSGFFLKQGLTYQELESQILEFAKSPGQDGGLEDKENLVQIKQFITKYAIIYSRKIQKEFEDEKY